MGQKDKRKNRRPKNDMAKISGRQMHVSVRARKMRLLALIGLSPG